MSQQAKSFEREISKRLHLDYLLHLPPGYGDDPTKKWPLILFLHGAGERGDDLALLKVTGLPEMLDRKADLPFIVVSPQCPIYQSWFDHMDALDALLTQIMVDYAVDTNRVYLTGLSMGGYGSWVMAVLWPERFAAVVPICGGGFWGYGFPERVCVLKDVPVWVFHGAKDDTVPLEESQVLVDMLESCGDNVKFTVYPEANHDSWTATYNNPDLYTWFLSHTR